MSRLEKHATGRDKLPRGPVVLAILDGIGIGRGDASDATTATPTPFLTQLKHSPFYTTLRAHGTAVGMPSDNDMGNSEVGHSILGAGRVFAQGAKVVEEAMRSGRLFTGYWADIVRHTQNPAHTLHLIGLLSDGNVHSHIDHLLGLIEHAYAQNVRQLRVHVLLDGRDVPRQSAEIYLAKLQACLDAKHNPAQGIHYRIASGGGRMQITMDRYEASWEMVHRGWQIHVQGIGPTYESAQAALAALRQRHPDVSDQDLPGFVIAENGHPVGAIRPHDAVVVFNFRGDRVMQLCRAFEASQFDAFARGPKLDVMFAGMILYDGDSHTPQHYLVAPQFIDAPLSQLLCEAGIRQLAVAETQKFGHVTYFWNGNRSGMFDARLERYVEIPSLPPPFDQAPQMQAQAITDVVCQSLGEFDFIRLNYANGDMVGHTGHFAATSAAVAHVDRCLSQLAVAVQQHGGIFVITADHGNAEDMFERDSQDVVCCDSRGQPIPKNSHSLNPVPCGIVLSAPWYPHFSLCQEHAGNLAILANTLLPLIGFAPFSGYLPGMIQAISHPTG